MSKSSTREISPPLVDILDLLANLSRDPDLGDELSKEVSDRLIRFACRVQKYSGLSVGDILETGQRLASGKTLEGADGLVAEYIGEERRDLLHVAARGHQLDTDGTTARLWNHLRREWPWFDEVWREARMRNAAAAEKEAQVADPAAPPTVRTPALAAPTGPGPDPSVPADKGTVRGKRPTVNQRMLEHLHREPESCHWSQRKWAAFLDCKPSAIAKAPAWKTAKAARALAVVDRLDRPR